MCHVTVILLYNYNISLETVTVVKDLETIKLIQTMTPGDPNKVISSALVSASSVY